MGDLVAYKPCEAQVWNYEAALVVLVGGGVEIIRPLSFILSS